MKLIYISRFQFKLVNNKIYSLPAYGDKFWEKYLDVFDHIHVIGEPVKKYLDNGNMICLTDKRISVEIIPSVERPNELHNDIMVNRFLKQLISKESAGAFLIKPSSRKGLSAIKLCEKHHKPYMIEMTGDVKTTLAERNNILMKLYGGFLYKKIVKGIKNCKFGLYVTEQYLQSKYPIAGVMCGCTDSIIPVPEKNTLDKRFKKIKGSRHLLKIGLIGYYHDTRKGIDTAIEALKRINMADRIYQLFILGVGTADDRDKWIKFAKIRNVERYLHFPEPVQGSTEVAKWIDTMDVIILPSRSEGFPRAIAETMSRACPAITSNVCGLQEMVDAKWQHEAGDSNQLAELILQLTSDKNQMQEAAAYNFEKSKKYAFEYLRSKRNAFLEQFKQYAKGIYDNK